jgi:glycosyltransferase involved in cell wall biosynthesis
MLDPVYLRRSRLTKCAARVLYENRNLRSAACLHALASHEADAIRACRLDNPVAVIPNGIDVRSFENLPCRHAASHTWPRLRGKKTILFLGRIHPVKGLVNLIQAWGHIAARFKDWHLVISGPDCEGHMATVQDQVCTRYLTEKVTFTGPAYGSAKLALLAAADVFVLPSISEGFSISTLEAMASRVPVLMTTRSGLVELQTAGAGRLIETSPESIAEGLDYMLSLSDRQRVEMGWRGNRLVAEKYSRTIVAQQMLSVYRWILGQGEKPACVIDN